MAAKDTDISPFQSTRALLDDTIRHLQECLREKREELSGYLDLLETDFQERQSEIESDMDQLDLLKRQTEAIAKNSLSELQQKLIEDISHKMESLQVEARHTPQVKLSFDRESVLAAIGGMSVVGYEIGGMEFESDEEKGADAIEQLIGGGNNKGRRGRIRRGRDKRGKGETEARPAEEALDKGKKKNKFKVEKKVSVEGEGELGEGTGGRRDKREDKSKKNKEDKKGLAGDTGPTHGKRAKNKSRGGTASFDAHALIESVEMTEDM